MTNKIMLSRLVHNGVYMFDMCIIFNKRVIKYLHRLINNPVQVFKISIMQNRLRNIHIKTNKLIIYDNNIENQIEKRIIFDNHMLYIYENIYNKIDLRKILDSLYEVCEYEEQNIIVYNMDRFYSLQNFEDIKNIAQHARTQDYSQKLISHKYKFVYLRNPKTGSSTIVDIITQIDPDVIKVEVGHRNIQHDILTDMKHQIKDYYYFTSARDPYARTLSAYKDMVLNVNERKYNRKYDIEKHDIETYYGIHGNISFKDFCEWLNSVYGSDVFANRHWISQYLHIYNSNIPFDYNLNYICKLETLNEDLHKIFIELNVDIEYVAKHLNRTSDKYEHVIIDDICKDMIYKRYKKDFKIFKYAK